MLGFTQEEVNHLLTDQLNLSDEQKLEMKNYYNGYLIGDCKFYNPLSVTKFIAKYKTSLSTA
jgi:hypothetical protein